MCLTEPSVLDVGFFLEGGHRVLGCVRVNNLKLAAAEPLLLVDSAPPPPPPLEVCTDSTLFAGGDVRAGGRVLRLVWGEAVVCQWNQGCSGKGFLPLRILLVPGLWLATASISWRGRFFLSSLTQSLAGYLFVDGCSRTGGTGGAFCIGLSRCESTITVARACLYEAISRRPVFALKAMRRQCGNVARWDVKED